MEILAWLVAAIAAVWGMRRVSKPVISELWKIPLMIWADFFHRRPVACIPLRMATCWDTPLFLAGIALWLAWALTFAAALFVHLTPLAFVSFEMGFLILAIPRAYNDSSVRRRLLRMCANDDERQAWLALFERVYPDLAKTKPTFFSSLDENLWRFVAATFLALFPLYSLALQLILSGLAGLAVQAITLACALIVGIIPLIRWAGAMVGGRYAWWIEYHMLLPDPG